MIGPHIPGFHLHWQRPGGTLGDMALQSGVPHGRELRTLSLLRQGIVRVEGSSEALTLSHMS